MSYGAYGEMEPALAGLLDGLSGHVISTKTVPEDGSFEFGDPVFVKADDDVYGYEADSTDGDLMFNGVAIRSPRSTRTTEGQYDEFDQVNVVERGRVWVPIVSGVTGICHRPAYVVDAAGATQKQYTKTSAGNYPTGGIFRSEPVDGLAILELQGINDESES